MEAALVVDGHLKQALAIVRSLGRQGIPVHCGAERMTALAGHSRHATRRFAYPSPYTDQPGFVSKVREAAARCGGRPVVYAGSDATWLTIHRFRAELQDAVTLLLPDDRSVATAFDKGATHRLARELSVPVITTHLCERCEEVERVGRELEYPAVVKTRHSVSWRDGVGVFGTASFVGDRRELLERFLDCRQRTGEAPLIQPLVRGAEYGVELLARDGRVIAETIHRRIRSMSPTGGASVVKETVGESDLSGSMRRHAHALAGSLSWSGPIMVEFKVDAATGEPKLMELNGRWWGSLPLAVRAGVDFPLLHHRMATGQALPERPVSARPGVVTRHLLGDARHLLRVLFARDPMRSRLYPGRGRALADFLRSFVGADDDIWMWSDPKPALMEYVDVLARIWR